MMAVDILRKEMPVARISRAMDIPRSSIYYRSIERSVNRKPRVSGTVENEINRISGERTTYSYRRIWALLRNSGIHVNIKTVRMSMAIENFPKMAVEFFPPVFRFAFIPFSPHLY